MAKMTLREFHNAGYLQECNRQFFHPLGLALALTMDGDTIVFDGIYDYRDDPEGVLYSEEFPDEDALAKAEHVERERAARVAARDALGCLGGVQPATRREQASGA